MRRPLRDLAASGSANMVRQRHRTNFRESAINLSRLSLVAEVYIVKNGETRRSAQSESTARIQDRVEFHDKAQSDTLKLLPAFYD